eukprot:8009085-Heterocapsa_arctica.AAC.1
MMLGRKRLWTRAREAGATGPKPTRRAVEGLFTDPSLQGGQVPGGLAGACDAGCWVPREPGAGGGCGRATLRGVRGRGRHLRGGADGVRATGRAADHGSASS